MTALPEFPREVGVYLRTWDLIPDGALITTRSSWVLPVSGLSGPSMLKIARIPDERAGYRLMSWWSGDGAAKILEASDDALLMERAVGRLDLARCLWILWTRVSHEAFSLVASQITKKLLSRTAL